MFTELLFLTFIGHYKQHRNYKYLREAKLKGQTAKSRGNKVRGSEQPKLSVLYRVHVQWVFIFNILGQIDHTETTNIS